MKVKQAKKKSSSLFQHTYISMALAQLGQNHKYYLVGITGRTSFILQNSSQQKFKLTIGNQLKCSCVHRQLMHCVHTLYALTEIFYLSPTHPLLMQSKYSNKDLRYIVANRIIHTNRILDFMKFTRGKLRKIQEREEGEDEEGEDVCAICQMEIAKNDGTVTCESECMNVFHLQCFTQWAKHEVNSSKMIKCPLCRDPKPSEYLDELKKKEYQLIEKRNSNRIGKQYYYYCDGCQLKQIQPSQLVYKCIVCEDVTLCATCFNVGKHIRHSFIYKSSSGDKWKESEDRKGKKRIDQQMGLIRIKLPCKRKFYNFLSTALPCYFSKNTRWNITQCKKLDIKIEELECIGCNDKQKAFLRRMSCGHFIHHRCLKRRIQKGKLFCKLDGQKFLQGYDSLKKHERLNKQVELKQLQQQSQQQQVGRSQSRDPSKQYERKKFRASPSKSINLRTESSVDNAGSVHGVMNSKGKQRSVKCMSNGKGGINRSSHNPE